MTDCSTISCCRLPPSQKRKAVWTVDGKPYCNTCYLSWIETHEWKREKIVRLFEDERLYEDMRPKRRRKRSLTTGVAVTA